MLGRPSHPHNEDWARAGSESPEGRGLAGEQPGGGLTAGPRSGQRHRDGKSGGTVTTPLDYGLLEPKVRVPRPLCSRCLLVSGVGLGARQMPSKENTDESRAGRRRRRVRGRPGREAQGPGPRAPGTGGGCPSKLQPRGSPSFCLPALTLQNENKHKPEPLLRISSKDYPGFTLTGPVYNF